MPKKGERMSDEQKLKISISHMGKSNPCAEETKRKMSEANKGKEPWNKGLTKEDDLRLIGNKHPRSEETKRKMSISQLHRPPRPKGMDSPNFKGGRRLRKGTTGYIILTGQWTHPRAHKGVISEHILVMEKKLGRYLRDSETVHHKNGIRDDNRPENLELWESYHPTGQRVEDMVAYYVATYPELISLELAIQYEQSVQPSKGATLPATDTVLPPLSEYAPETSSRGSSTAPNTSL